MRLYVIFVALFICAKAIAQNRYYDYSNRVPGGKTHILYLSGDGTHGSLEVAAILRKFLEVRHDYFITYTEDYSILSRSLEKYDIILINNIPPHLTEEELNGFSKAIKEGKPFLGLHAASAFYNLNEQGKEVFFDIIGAEFITHPPIHDFEVNIKQPNTLITKNLPDFNIYDEMYFFKNQKPDNDILMSATYKRGVIGFNKNWEEKRTEIAGNTPLTWTRQYGKGKVFYTSLGHSVGAVSNRYYQQLILQGLKWLLEND